MKQGETKNSTILLWLLTVLTGLTCGYSLYLILFQTPLLSRRELLFALISFVASCGAAYFILKYLLIPIFQKMKASSRRGWLAAGAAFGIFILVITGKPAISIWTLPEHELWISRIEGRDPQSSGDVIQVGWMTTGLSDISFSSLGLEGDWQRDGDTLLNTGKGPATLSWQGRVGNNAVVLFTARPDGGVVTFSWDGKDQIINLYSPEPKALPVEQEFVAPLFSRLLGAIAIWGMSAFLFLTITLFILKHDLVAHSRKHERKLAWLRFAIPMILVWGIFLLTFWPGMMSRDSIDQWGQLVSGHFSDGHPAFHTMLLWLITRLWNLPTAVAIVQILALSLTASWGINALIESGLSRRFAWGLAVIFAVSPVNAVFSITIWKDVAYATAIFLFTIQILKIIFSKGSWLENKTNWFWLGLTATLASLLRHNGMPVAAVSLLGLIIFYRTHWRKIVFGIGLFMALYFAVKGPLYDLVMVDPMTETKQVIFLHHIAAHITKGTELLPVEKALLDQIEPVEKWKYNCCAITATYYDPGFKPDVVDQNAGELLNIFLALLARDPMVDLNHWMCTSSLVWKVQTTCPVTAGLLSPDAAPLTWIIPNDLGLVQQSQIPGLVPVLSKIYMLRAGTPLFLLLWSPAIYFYLSLFCSSILALRRHSWRYLLFLLPTVLQSAVLFLVNISFQFRYQYPVYLIGLFSISFLFLSKSSSSIKHTNSGKE